MVLNLISMVVISLLGAEACTLPDPSAGTRMDYSDMRGYYLDGDRTDRFVRYAPVFIVEEYSKSYNRIGTPAARYDAQEEEDIYVDSTQATYYTEVINWESSTHKYTNLIFRVHFEMSKKNKFSTDGGKGYNTGSMVIVTIDEKEEPVLVNVIQTCGCFHVLLPTNYLDDSALPEHWAMEEQTVYGEKLSGSLKYSETFSPDVHPVIFLRSANHRAAEIHAATLVSIKDKYPLTQADMMPMDALDHLKLGDGDTSFFHTEGKYKGLVKGAIKKKETFLLGVIVGDSRVGQDRRYGSPVEVPRGFYTSIKPGKQDASDMWDYPVFLQYEGWNF